MPKPIPRRAKRPIVSLHFRHRRYLLTGRPGALHFLEREHVENLWAEYGAAITERHARKWPGSRPAPYWRYQRLPEKWDNCKESQYSFLHRHHLLLPGENARARQQRRSSTRPVAPVPLHHPLSSLTTTPPSGWQFVLIDGRAELVRVKPDAGPR
jgi:hypothetical protein